MVASEDDKLLQEKIDGKIILITIVWFLFFIELENELQEKTKELMISNETLQVTTGTV